ncbi:MAG: aminomethyl-transferring glycine dehydrogenase subunit GcvPA [Deltaproteobacteria bacterium]|nr:aminomethyl-transferring glycine dehydrogenase subunit GcvPA [Deltaproteobacteria bacterium]
MRYFPHTAGDVESMLSVVGRHSLDELFSSIPPSCRLEDKLDLPDPMTEWELNDHMNALAAANTTSENGKLFIGAGSYDHFIPASVAALSGRSEFVTSYTPYQPEISQGTLQAIYEYQTLTARLLGLETANASMYDGASALAEGMLMALRLSKKRTIALSRLIHPHCQGVVRTYLAPTDCTIVELPCGTDGRTDLSPLKGRTDIAAVAVQSPNFFGVIEDLETIVGTAKGINALTVASFTEALAYGLLQPPGYFGADIACGEGQSMGIPRIFGGPALGMFASRMEYVRNMPGRLVGVTSDREGARGFVLTLSTREQHIRREKATSNICTNNSLCALIAAIYMASLGGTGLRRLAQLNRDKSEYLKSGLLSRGFRSVFTGQTFNEFVLEAPAGFSRTYRKLLERKIVAGLRMDRYYPDLKNHYLFCATERHSKADMDALLEEVNA